MDIYENAKQLQKIPLLSGSSRSQLKLLAFCSEAISFNPGEYLFKINDTADCVYVILHGEVEVIWDKNPEHRVNLAILGKNNILGEIGVFLNKPRNSSVIAIDKVQTLRIPSDRFLKLLTESPDAALEVMRQLSRKFCLTNQIAINSKNELLRLQTNKSK